MNMSEHILDCIGEEGSEIAKDVSKCLRFGLEDRNVLDPNGPTNQERLIHELNDLIGVVQLAVELGIIPEHWEDRKKQELKKRKIIKFMKYAREVGALDK
jgi:hypothetical protein